MSILTASGRRRWSGQWIDNQQPYAFPTVTPFNVPDEWPAITPTYDGSGQAMHPDVIDFRQVLGRPWRGWRYWMVMTPYPGSDETLENPSILVSNDGYNWRLPAGLTNPIYPPPGSGWSSDVDMVYDPTSDELVMCYHPTTTTLAVGRSSNGVTWSPLSYVTRAPLTGLSGTVAPSLLRLSDGTWRAWVTGKRSADGSYVLMAYSMSDPLNWGTPVDCTYNGSVKWHSNVVFHAGRYWLIGAGSAASSLDGVTWQENPTPAIAAPLWHVTPYRCALQPHENGTHMRVWYSGELNGSTPRVWHTYYTQIPLTEWPAL